MEATAATGRDYELGFRDLDDEVRIDSVEVRGELPPWLRGSLLRTGPAKWDFGSESVRHWFDGLAMLHRFGFADGRVSYANRFLRTRDYERAREDGKIGYRQFATDPCRAIFKKVHSIFKQEPTENCNVNLMCLGERFVAMTEAPLPVEFDPLTLETFGASEKAPGQVTTAHPHHDPVRGEAINYAARFGPRTTYRIYGERPDGSRRTIAELPVSEPSYMHSFGLTEHYVVLAQYPLVINPMQLAIGEKPFIESYRWEPERGTRFLLVDRESGEEVATVETEPFFAFHHVNAWEEDGEVVADLVAYRDPEIIETLYIDRALSPDAKLPGSQVRRFRLRPGDGGSTSEVLLEGTLELPRFDYSRRNGRPYRHLYIAGVRGNELDFLNELIKLDTETGEVRSWHEPGCYPGEPVLATRPGGEDEDDGAILSIALDARSGRSFLLVLDARSFEELARAEVPHHIPFHFHGQFFSD